LENNSSRQERTLKKKKKKMHWANNAGKQTVGIFWQMFAEVNGLLVAIANPRTGSVCLVMVKWPLMPR
jgi:hypothetical protein